LAGAASFGATEFGRGRGAENRMDAGIDGAKEGAMFGVGGSLLGMLLKK
jgi:hypothetical protein